jgi:hypothetical protein
MSFTTPDKLADQIRTDRQIDRATSLYQRARDEERLERDIQIAQDFAQTARLARALSN